MRKSVDLPAPERPMIPVIVPAGTSRLTSSSAMTWPEPFFSKDFPRAAKLIAAPVVCVSAI